MSTTRNLAVILAVILASSGAAFAQAAGPMEQVKQWNAVIGKWVNQEEWRNGPDEPWEKVSSEWDTQWIAGGFFVESPGKRVFANGQEDRWEQIWGFDPAQKTHFSMWFNNAGGMGRWTYQWTGTTLEFVGTDVSSDGTESRTRCTWEHTDNYTKADARCERLTDGKWWVYQKVRGAKQ
jgi:hypothetical protein